MMLSPVRCHNSFAIFTLAVLAQFSTGLAELCEDRKHNFIMANSDHKHPHEAMIHEFGGVVYKSDNSPSCNKGRPTVLMPGLVTFLQGRLTVPKKYDLVRSGLIKMTVRSPNFDEPLCLDGKSQYVVMPNRFCTFELCSFIGNDVCELLSSPGLHTLEEMEQKIGFNRTQILPEPPSLFGISLLDLFSGEFSFDFALEHDGKVILQLQIPSNDKYLQIGVDDSTNDSGDVVTTEAPTPHCKNDEKTSGENGKNLTKSGGKSHGDKTPDRRQ